jgi:hypothetical protein
MRYILCITLANNKKRTFPITASNEKEAKEKLLLRLPPNERDTVRFDSVSVDPRSVEPDEDPFGSFLN